MKAVDCHSDGRALGADDQALWETISAGKKRMREEQQLSRTFKKRKGAQGSDKEGSDDEESSPSDEDSDSTAVEGSPVNDSFDLPFALGEVAGHRLLSEIALGGILDTSHQVLALHYTALAEEDALSRLVLGSKLAPAAVEYLRLAKDFFGLEFGLKEVALGVEGKAESGVMPVCETGVLASCVGVGLANLSRRTF